MPSITEPAPSTIAELLAAGVAAAGDAPALIAAETGADTLSYIALQDAVRRLAADLARACGPNGRRPRIGIVLPNGPEMSVTLLAAALVGEATPFNPALTAAEFGRYFEATRIDALLVAEGAEGPATEVAARIGLPVLERAASGGLVGGDGTADVPAPGPDDIAMVLMTSGSTGMPKIVPLSHRNVCRSAADVAASVALGPEHRCLVMWQQFHIGGLVDLLLAPLLAGSALIVTGGFDAARFFALLDQERPTWFQGVPTTLGALVQHAERHGLAPRGSSLRFLRSVAAALTPALQDRLEETFGVPVLRTLGMTEAGPLITSTALPPALDKPGSVGRPCGPDLRVFGPDMAELPTGETGDIAIRGDNVFAGYENNPDANAAAFRHGWFFTGDRGYLDPDGDLFLTGRAKEQINRGGYKIMPSEVEEALSRHPDVLEAAVFGLPHPTLGEDVAAAVSLRAGAAPDPSALRKHLMTLVAANKVPGRIAILPELPRNPVGKVDRLALAQSAEAEAEAEARSARPGTDMERFLERLWAQELSLPKIGIHQDFTMAGGDSLAALRIQVAMDSAFGRDVPDELMIAHPTIAAMAEALEAAGFAAPTDADENVDAVAERALGEAGIGVEIEDRSDAFAAALGSATRASDLQAAFEDLTTYSPPAAILAALEKTPADASGTSASLPTRLLLRRRYQGEADVLRKEIGAAGPGALGWRRTALTPDVLHYSDDLTPAWDKTLIVGFTGKLMRLQLPTYRVLLHLDPAAFDLVLLRDPSHRLFAGGLPEVGDSLMKLGAWLDDFAETGGYARRIALGTSGGGLAALHCALTYGWDRAVAASPPAPSKHPEIGGVVASAAAGDHGATDLVLAHALGERDVTSADKLHAILPGARRDIHRDSKSHNVLDTAHRNGKLAQLFEAWFG